MVGSPAGSRPGVSAVGRFQRLPTKSAAQLLSSTIPTRISTGLDRLDTALHTDDGSRTGQLVGLVPGRMTVVYGPPGSGKTVLCGQIARSVLGSTGSVVWIDCGPPVYLPAVGIESEKLRQYCVPTAAHLAAILSQPGLFDSAGLVIIENVSIVLASAQSSTPTSTSSQPGPSSGSFVSRLPLILARLAASRSIPILVSSSVNSRVRAGPAVLVPALGPGWDGIGRVRLLLFRDWVQDDGTADPDALVQNRFLALIKTKTRNGSTGPDLPGGDGTIGRDGVGEVVCCFPVAIRNGRMEEVWGSMAKLPGRSIEVESQAVEVADPSVETPILPRPESPQDDDNTSQFQPDALELPTAATTIAIPKSPVKRSYSEIADSDQDDPAEPLKGRSGSVGTEDEGDDWGLDGLETL